MRCLAVCNLSGSMVVQQSRISHLTSEGRRRVLFSVSSFSCIFLALDVFVGPEKAKRVASYQCIELQFAVGSFL